mmetsp:Transcript_27608/g.95460  ORF Transcript_27608/g.95460 Transcript_27608/m.95460 type:complete len:287 (-) Transcript_27608:54-914(-)
MVHREKVAGARQPGLHLVADEQRAVRGADLLALRQVAVVGDNDARLTLDGFHHEGSHLVGPQLCDLGFERLGVVVGHRVEVGHVRPIALVRVRVGGRRDRGQGAPPEVLLGKDDMRLVLSDALHVVRPAARELDGCLARLDARVHRKNAVEAQQLRHELLERAQAVVVERTRRQRERRALLLHGFDQPRVAVALVHRAVRRQKVVVALVIDVVHERALATLQHDGKRCVVLCTVLVLQIQVRLRACGHRHRPAMRHRASHRGRCASAASSQSTNTKPCSATESHHW